MSDFFGKLKSGAGKVAFEAEKMARLNRAQGELGKLKGQIDAQYHKLGEMTYQRFVSQAAEGPEFAQLCQGITDLQRQVAEKNQEIQHINADVYSAAGAPPPAPAPAPAAPAPFEPPAATFSAPPPPAQPAPVAAPPASAPPPLVPFAPAEPLSGQPVSGQPVFGQPPLTPFTPPVEAPAYPPAPEQPAAPQPQSKTCPSCGKEMPLSAKFCPDCGTKM